MDLKSKKLNDETKNIDQKKQENIFLFYPNLIGYLRIIFAFVSVFYMQTDYKKATLFYSVSSFLDAFDGYAARYFQQSTTFGSILDQLTDRAGLLFLNMTLCVLYPKYLIWFQLSSVIDITSHWMYIWVGTLKGKTSHKLFDPSQNKLLNIYYTSKPVLFFMCAVNEIFYGLLYVIHFNQGLNVPYLNIGLYKLIMLICAPFSILKTFISLIHLIYASVNVGIIDSDIRSVKKN